MKNVCLRMCENTGLSLLLVRFSRVVIGQTESRDPIYAQQTLAPSDGEKSLAMAHPVLKWALTFQVFENDY